MPSASAGRRTVTVLVVVLTLSTAGAGIWYTQFRCDDDLALDTPNAAVAFERNASAGTLTVRHAGSDALLDADDWTNRGCREEWEPDAVIVVVNDGDSNQRQYLWVARNGSGPGHLPLRAGDAVTLVEPETSSSGAIRLEKPLETGDTVRVVGRGDGASATFGRYIVDSRG